METMSKGTGVARIETAGVKTYQTTAFKPRPTLLLDVLPEDNMTNSPPVAIQKAGLKPAGNQDKPDEIFAQLLKNAETFAQRTQSSKMRWQLATLIMGLTLATAAVLIACLAIYSAHQHQRKLANQNLTGQLNTLKSQIGGFQNEIEALISRNTELAGENSRLKYQTNLPASKKQDAFIAENAKNAEKKSKINSAVSAESGTSRVEAIKKGKILSGASKTELITALGQPDRVYAARNYEQLVYFGRKPGRFWFIGGYLVQATE
jgi:hypothetical protein